jgi:hypothetical protein
LVKAAPVAGSILTTDNVQTASRTQAFGGFAQTWNGLGNYTKNFNAGGIESSSYTDGTDNASQFMDSGTFNTTVNSTAGGIRSGAAYVSSNGVVMELSGPGGTASISVVPGTIGAANGVPQVYLETVGVNDLTAVNGQVLTLTNALTGESEFVTAPSSIDTIQTASATGATAIMAWNSVVLIPTLTGNATLTYPVPSAGVGKTIKVVQTGVPNAFTITHMPTASTLTLTNAAGELASAGGAITVEAVDNANVRQVSNAVAAATSTVLTYGRVNAINDLVATTFVIAAPGTKIPFNNTVYNSGMTFTGTDAIVPSQTGRYRISWFLLGPSGDFNDNGTVHVVQNGVSVGSVFIDIMVAAGVNQIAGFIDANLVIGLPVELRFQPVVADSIPWGRGSYFDINQLPTAVAPQVDTVAEYGESNLAADYTLTTLYANAPGLSVVLPTAGTYRIRYDASIQMSDDGTTARTAYARLFDATVGVEVPHSSTTLGSITNEVSGTLRTVRFCAGNEAVYTVTGPTTINVQGYISAATSGSSIMQAKVFHVLGDYGGCKILHQKIAGQTSFISGLTTADQTASGYFDIGNMRIQWGLHNDGNVDTTTVTLPAPYLNDTYTVTATSNSGTAGSVAVEAKLTTSFDLDRASTTVNTNVWGWQTIGLKP